VHVANLGAADEAAVVALLAGVAPSLSADKVRVVRDKFGNSKGFAYVDLAGEAEVAAVLAAGETRALKLGDRTVDVSRARALHAHKDAAAMDPKTLYVLGLTEAATKEGIRALFEPCGAVADVRLMRDREGALRGFCYVEFEDANGAAAGLRCLPPPPSLPY